MSRTDKDSREAKMRHWMSVFTPSKFNQWRRRQEREWARQALRNGEEPQPRYRDELYW